MMYSPFLYARAKARGKTILKIKDYEKMLDLTPGEILVRLQDIDPIYKKLIETHSIYFSSYELVDFISRHAPPQEVGEFYSMVNCISSDTHIKGVFKALLMRFLINNIRIYFIGEIESMKFDDLVPWMHDIKPLTIEQMRYFYDRGLPYQLLKKAKLPISVIDRIIKASKQNKLGEIFFTLYEYYLKLLDVYPSEITSLLKRIELNSLIIKARYLGIDDVRLNKTLSNYNAFIMKGKNVFKENNDCCLFHIEAKNFIYYYKRKVNRVDAVIAYLLIKELQATNLRLILKHKGLGLSREEVLQRLAVIR